MTTTLPPAPSAYETILFEKDGPAVRLILNRPHRLNAVTLRLYEELIEAIGRAENDPSVRTVVLTGQGRAFCVGADLKEHHTRRDSRAEKQKYADAAQQVCLQIQKSAKPYVCAIRGYALGAGAEMALSCDFVLMAADARIGFPEISIGTYVGGGLSYLLPALVGLPKTRELLYLGDRIAGEEAQRIGLIYRSVISELLDREVGSLVDRLASLAPIPLAIAKQQLADHRLRNEESSMALEVDALLRCMESEDWAEGVRAFNEKRRPEFKGR